MGSLIQTKGTQRLAHLFNNRFDTGSIAQTRAVKNASGTSLQGAFAGLPDLRSISDIFIAQFASNHWVPNVRDVLYPAATLIAVTIAPGAVAGTTDVTFNDPSAGWPLLIANGISAADLDHPVGVPKGATVINVARGNPVAGQTKVTFNAVVTAQVTDRISFCPVKHQNLVRRWRYYLENELVGSNHTAIQSAALTALTDLSVTSVRFQAVESSTQTVFVETIFATTDADDDNLDPTHKSLFVALMTARTKAPDPVDDP
jgi:hypothetical protein